MADSDATTIRVWNVTKSNLNRLCQADRRTIAAELDWLIEKEAQARGLLDDDKPPVPPDSATGVAGAPGGRGPDLAGPAEQAGEAVVVRSARGPA